MEYGYVRVSSKDQNIARQMAAMYEVGIDDKHIYITSINFQEKILKDRIIKGW